MAGRKAKSEWHFLDKNPDDLPDPGERVIICVGKALVGEGYIKHYNGERRWFRYDEFAPVEAHLNSKVTAWTKMLKSPWKEREKEEKQANA